MKKAQYMFAYKIQSTSESLGKLLDWILYSISEIVDPSAGTKVLVGLCSANKKLPALTEVSAISKV